MDDKDLKILFKSHKTDFSGDGFTHGVMEHLPDRSSFLPYIITFVCLLVGIIITVSIQGPSLVAFRIEDLVHAVTSLQMPSMLSVFTYLGGLFFTSMVVFAISWTCINEQI